MPIGALGTRPRVTCDTALRTKESYQRVREVLIGMLIHIFCLIINVFDYQTYIRKTVINDMIIKVLDDII